MSSCPPSSALKLSTGAVGCRGMLWVAMGCHRAVPSLVKPSSYVGEVNGWDQAFEVEVISVTLRSYQACGDLGPQLRVEKGATGATVQQVSKVFSQWSGQGSQRVSFLVILDQKALKHPGEASWGCVDDVCLSWSPLQVRLLHHSFP